MLRSMDLPRVFVFRPLNQFNIRRDGRREVFFFSFLDIFRKTCDLKPRTNGTCRSLHMLSTNILYYLQVFHSYEDIRDGFSFRRYTGRGAGGNHERVREEVVGEVDVGDRTKDCGIPSKRIKI